jgi:hypothetical protein
MITQETIINMANLSASTGIDSNKTQLGIFQFSNGSDSGNYIHMETTITQPSSNVMMMLEAVGYNYGGGNPIRCSWNFYSYAYPIGNTNNGYAGMNADGIYYTSAGYVAIRAYAGSPYYIGFTLNAYPTAGNGTGQPIGIRRVSQNSNGGSYY